MQGVAPTLRGKRLLTLKDAGGRTPKEAAIGFINQHGIDQKHIFSEDWKARWKTASFRHEHCRASFQVSYAVRFLKTQMDSDSN